MGTRRWVAKAAGVAVAVAGLGWGSKGSPRPAWAQTTKNAAAGETGSGQDKRGDAGRYFGGVYTKPFWKRIGGRVAVGGYMDTEFRIAEGGQRTFRQVRMIPFIYSDIAKNLRFATEIEFEWGGIKDKADVVVTTSTGKGTASLTGEVVLEFAFLDYQFAGESLGLRIGMLLSPLGRFNLIHDSPLNELTDRPLVSRSIIPTTLSETGAGIFGTFYPKDVWKVGYELYAVNGFNGGTNGDKITSSNGLRDARGGHKLDNENSPAFVGRLSVSPRLGYEFGVSAHAGGYDADNSLAVVALDWGFSRGPLRFSGEWARAGIGRSAKVLAAGKTPAAMSGYYAEFVGNFLQDKVRKGSSFAGVIRWDDVNTAMGDPKGSWKNERLTLGLNFRPVQETVFKMDYQFNLEDFSMSKVKNNGFNFSMATYF